MIKSILFVRNMMKIMLNRFCCYGYYSRKPTYTYTLFIKHHKHNKSWYLYFFSVFIYLIIIKFLKFKRPQAITIRLWFMQAWVLVWKKHNQPIFFLNCDTVVIMYSTYLFMSFWSWNLISNQFLFIKLLNSKSVTDIEIYYQVLSELRSKLSSQK